LGLTLIAARSLVNDPGANFTAPVQ